MKASSVAKSAKLAPLAKPSKSVRTDVAAIGALLNRRVERVVGDLEARLASGRRLRIKFGADPTAPDLHLGHAVPLRKLREFQELGHRVVLIIGDYTALVGDPSGKSKTRPTLTKKEVDANAKTYLAQVGKILDLKKTEIRRNGEWFGNMKFDGVLKLASQFTVAQMTSREDFRTRLDAGVDVHMHELLYPMMQAYDSIMVEADVEIGGIDQTFNILAGRDLQRHHGKPEQACLLLGPLLVGTDGSKKMSKSLGNYVGLTDSADEMFGKVMSIPDAALRDWFALTTDLPKADVDALLAPDKNPRDAKMRLAHEIISQYHSSQAADAAEEQFRKVFQKKEIPDDVAEVRVAAGQHGLIDLLVATGMVTSKGEARRVIAEGGVKVDGAVMKDIATGVVIGKTPVLVQKGKRHFVRVVAK